MELIIKDKIIKIVPYKGYFKKLKGLMFEKKAIDYGIRLKTNGIHTFFMKQAIDVCITDKENKILYLREKLDKNNIVWPIKKGYYTYELPLNTIKELKVGKSLNLK